MGVRWHRGLTLNVDFATEVGETLFVGGTCEPNEMRFIATVLAPGMTAIDVGANVGWITLLMAGCVGRTGRVVAFEPSSRERRVLAINQRCNGLTWVNIRGEALFDECSTVALHVADVVHSGHNTLGGFIYEDVSEVQTVSVPAVPLDSLAGELGLRRVDLIKIDVEGAECRVLRGAQETLGRHRPILVLEAQPASLRVMGDDIGSLLMVLEDMHYAVCRFDEATGMPSLDRSLPLSANVVAVPRESVEHLTELGAIAPPHPSWICASPSASLG